MVSSRENFQHWHVAAFLLLLISTKAHRERLEAVLVPKEAMLAKILLEGNVSHFVVNRSKFPVLIRRIDGSEHMEIVVQPSEVRDTHEVVVGRNLEAARVHQLLQHPHVESWGSNHAKENEKQYTWKGRVYQDQSRMGEAWLHSPNVEARSFSLQTMLIELQTHIRAVNMHRSRPFAWLDTSTLKGKIQLAAFITIPIVFIIFCCCCCCSAPAEKKERKQFTKFRNYREYTHGDTLTDEPEPESRGRKLTKLIKQPFKSLAHKFQS